GYGPGAVWSSPSYPRGFGMLPLRLRLALTSVALFAAAACMLPPTSLPPRDPAPDPVVAGPQVQAAARSVNEFAADLYAQLRTENGNLIVSPYSISMALNMTAAGAEGNTLDEMQKVLHATGGKLKPAFGELAES